MCKPCDVQHLMDRIAISLGADVPIDIEQRVAAMESAKRFQVWECVPHQPAHRSQERLLLVLPTSDHLRAELPGTSIMPG